MRILVNNGTSSFMVDTGRTCVEIKPFQQRQAINNACYAILDQTNGEGDSGRNVRSLVDRGHLTETKPESLTGMKACNLHVVQRDGIIQQSDRRSFELANSLTAKFLIEKYPALRRDEKTDHKTGDQRKAETAKG